MDHPCSLVRVLNSFKNEGRDKKIHDLLLKATGYQRRIHPSQQEFLEQWMDVISEKHYHDENYSSVQIDSHLFDAIARMATYICSVAYD